ncbi:MAG: hypothetical protein JOZ76_27205 [Bradyrhizobium sp.]|nr:hypothetical protein [Bradyrhizobium sp.]MBV8921717.1 hypothetical protein [Bradyrhizobium sp.]
MNPRRCAIAAAALTVILAGWVVAWLAGFGSAVIENSGAAPLLDCASSLAADAEHADVPQATAMGNAASDQAEEARTGADLTGSLQTLPPETPPVQAARASTPDMRRNDIREDVSSVEIVDDCLIMDTCIDRYLWTLYQRAPKEDTIKVEEQRKVTVKRKGKTRTVTRSFTRLVDEDFAWKDPKAAQKAAMPMTDYVIGGMDRGFRLRLFQALHAAEENGLAPGITSAFRDDYRQSLASGLRAATDRSYHGGSFRGGYGHGLAADVVSVKGGTRDQRWTSSEILWKWIDEHGKEFGIGRPYLDRDPAHVAPIDGKEYADHHGTKVRHAESHAKNHKRLAVRDDRNAAKRPRAARSS